jgi:hypothetical protein
MKYDDKSQRKSILKWWLKRGYRLALTGENIQASTFIPNSNPNLEVFAPYHSYKFVWSVSSEDPVRKKARNKLDRLKKNGHYEAVQYSVTYPGEIYQAPSSDPFPCELDEFMRDGVQYFTSTFHDYFYRRLEAELAGPETATLLETFVLNDLINE